MILSNDLGGRYSSSYGDNDVNSQLQKRTHRVARADGSSDVLRT